MSLVNVAIVALLAVAAPLLTRAVPRLAIAPVIVVEILLGIGVGPHVLGLLQVDAPVDTLAVLGLSFLFFLAGIEVDLGKIRGQLLARSLAAYVVGLGLALGVTASLGVLRLIDAPVLVAVAFSATGLGLVVPILRDTELLRTAQGGAVMALASVAEFAAVIVLALAFSTSGSPAGDVAFLVVLIGIAVGVTVLAEKIRARSVVASLVDRLSGGTTQLRVRLSVALVVGFAALAQAGGLELVLGAFFAGGILNVLDNGMADPGFRGRLDGVGYGFLVPAFFVTSGARLDFSALSLWPDALTLVPLLLGCLVVARAVPSALLVPGPTDLGAVGVGLLCATSLPFIVTAAQVGVATGRLDPSTAAAMTSAGLVGVCLFPPVATAFLRRSTTHSRPAPAAAGLLRPDPRLPP
jgi:Kef-type K+ transport system membrane component KefB